MDITEHKIQYVDTGIPCTQEQIKTLWKIIL